MTDAQWESGLALKLHGARRLTIAAWPALKAAKGSVVLMSGNSALFPKASGGITFAFTQPQPSTQEMKNEDADVFGNRRDR
jgi:hypothetical protein